MTDSKEMDLDPQSLETKSENWIHSHVAGYPLIKYSDKATIRHWATNFAKEMLKLNELEAEISWEQNEHGIEIFKLMIC